MRDNIYRRPPIYKQHGTVGLLPRLRCAPHVPACTPCPVLTVLERGGAGGGNRPGTQEYRHFPAHTVSTEVPWGRGWHRISPAVGEAARSVPEPGPSFGKEDWPSDQAQASHGLDGLLVRGVGGCLSALCPPASAAREPTCHRCAGSSLLGPGAGVSHGNRWLAWDPASFPVGQDRAPGPACLGCL